MGKSYNGGRVILVVDDNDTNREVLNLFLSGRGYSVIEASNGILAIELARSKRPDLIIMDLAMPVMDGFTAARLLRDLPDVGQTPIVACTGNDTAFHRERATALGFKEFLTKPIDFIHLNLVINRFLKTA